ncbi:hypothetical protein [Nostoc sp.]|uniref:hypothetical protein n=1 Tax=Nostoc sp. TaxID=1180 RepID=UPI002FF763F7
MGVILKPKHGMYFSRFQPLTGNAPHCGSAANKRGGASQWAFPARNWERENHLSCDGSDIRDDGSDVKDDGSDIRDNGSNISRNFYNYSFLKLAEIILLPTAPTYMM